MEVPEWIQAADEHCADGRRLRGLAGDVWTREVSDEEDTLLAAGADGAEFTLHGVPNRVYPIICADEMPVFDRRDEYHMAVQWEAFCDLCRRGIVDPAGDHGGFYLTDIARDRGHQVRAHRLFGQPGVRGS